MSPRKLTEDDKQEILEQYRNSEATTSTLAKSFEVSSSTISRFLKNKLSTTEYEDLIQQKRLARTPRGEKSASDTKSNAKKTKVKKSTAKKTITKSKSKAQAEEKPEQLEIAVGDLQPEEQLPATEVPIEVSVEETSKPTITRRRRRSTAAESIAESITSDRDRDRDPEIAEVEIEQPEPEPIVEEVKEPAPTRLVLDKKIRSRTDSEPEEAIGNRSSGTSSQRLILKGDRIESEDDDEDDDMDITALKEMLGEDLEDINDEEDEEDEEDWEEDEGAAYPGKSSDLGDIEILPLSQALLPRTCYLVIDRSAELIVKPLADFADLGIIPEAEVRQRTLPVFDNHRIAKRFSHRRERVIKVPDGSMIQKTSHHLQDKGITRLLIDGRVYSLSN